MDNLCIKRNSIIETLCNPSKYKPLIDYLKQNLSTLYDFVISEKEILDKVQSFNYEDFLKEFKDVSEFKNLDFLVSPHDPKVFHVIIKGTEIPSDYTKDVINDISKNGYDTSRVKESVEYWKNIKEQADKELKQISPQIPEKVDGNIYTQKQSENFAAYNQNTQSLDGSYGTQIYKDRETGRFYSNPSHDNYSEDSNS